MTRMIINVGCLIAAGALFFMYTKPAYDALGVVQKQIEQYNLALEKAAELQRLKQELLSRYNSFNPADIDRLHKLLPDHVDNVRLILDLDTLASQHGLALQNIVISAPTQGARPGNELVIGPADLGTYDSLTLSFKTIGPYERFVTFLTDLEHSLRIVDVEKLVLNASVSDAQAYTFDIELRTYWLK